MQITDMRHYNKYVITAIEAALMLVSINIYLIHGYSLFHKFDNDIMLSMAYVGLIIWILWIRKNLKDEIVRDPFFIAAGLIGSLIFSVLQFADKGFTALTVFGPLRYFENIPSFIRTVAAIAGGTLLYWFIILTVMFVFTYIRNNNGATGYVQTWADRIVDGEHVFLKCTLFILFVWLPQIIVRYPGIMQHDGWLTLKYYWQDSELLAAHDPAVFSLLLGKASEFGLSIGHPAWGIFALALIQVTVNILIMSYTITVMKQLRVPSYCRMAALLFYAFLPAFSSISTTVIADAFYLPAFLLMVTELIIAVRDTDTVIRKPYHIALIILAAAGLSFRYCGIFIMVLILAGLILWMAACAIRRYKLRSSILIVTCVFLVSVVTVYLVTGCIDTDRTSDSLISTTKKAMALQQVGRCTRNHPESFDEDDIDALNEVISLDINTIAVNYDPYRYDKLEYYFKKDASPEQMKAFYNVWYKMLKCHPGTCIGAIVQQGSGLFSILSYNMFYYDDSEFMIHRDYFYDYADLYHYKTRTLHSSLKEYLIRYYDVFRFLPIIGLLTCLALYTILLFVLLLTSICEGDWKKLIILLPLIGVLGIVIFGPTGFNYYRLAYPVMYAMPVVFAESAVTGRTISESKVDRQHDPLF